MHNLPEEDVALKILDKHSVHIHDCGTCKEMEEWKNAIQQEAFGQAKFVQFV
jgi:hypothetical protein